MVKPFLTTFQRGFYRVRQTLRDNSSRRQSRPWWGLPCTVRPCFGARLVQEGNRLHYLADRAGIRGRFSDAD
ncbi:type IV toxin-antitoxin system YeeU family antitoxin, partial [Escherichia coli]|nr:type IV toxin-antitoxin system YeeU family antitoxin [Escherichia coli]MBV2293569.1 type IV toxin-antitoxin system YeeU family antitoxin [Escherichia coli]MBV2335672.1 type IV toxin-antitoxin system YeeU family antitoxin [Escherichia coli]MBV2400965.1 type IV toxin-antitoxin system YeeU family antitoxin [Escherichia coli]